MGVKESFMGVKNSCPYITNVSYVSILRTYPTDEVGTRARVRARGQLLKNRAFYTSLRARVLNFFPDDLVIRMATEYDKGDL